MIIKSAVLSSVQSDVGKFPNDGKFEIALFGRSNVGKSSFINALCERRSLARTSSAPGKTRTANFYLINDEFYFVDLPGYGYAKASKSEHSALGKIINDYLNERKADFMALHLLDHRHKPSEEDKKMRTLMLEAGITPVSVLTKTDKLTKNERARTFDLIMRELGIEEGEAVFEFSNIRKEMAEEIKDFIGEMVCSI